MSLQPDPLTKINKFVGQLYHTCVKQSTGRFMKTQNYKSNQQKKKIHKLEVDISLILLVQYVLFMLW